jgi:redox-sensitive bicupin YhaK (pirin superfamily)
MKTIIHKSENRGYANHGWLEARHSFSFAGYFDSRKMNFGVLRVLNDDIVQPGKGFGTHPHDNMEIITIPLKGALAHKDSMGNSSVIKAGEVQVMSAGSGVEHSEFNHSAAEPINLLQIWIYPNQRNVEPRYQQAEFNPEGRKNKFQQIVSPNHNDEGLWIYQNAWLNLTEINAGKQLEYKFNDTANGLYVFVIEGLADIADNILNRRDAIGITEIETIQIRAVSDSYLLLLEVPMNR